MRRAVIMLGLTTVVSAACSMDLDNNYTLRVVVCEQAMANVAACCSIDLDDFDPGVDPCRQYAKSAGCVGTEGNPEGKTSFEKRDSECFSQASCDELVAAGACSSVIAYLTERICKQNAYGECVPTAETYAVEAAFSATLGELCGR